MMPARTTSRADTHPGLDRSSDAVVVGAGPAGAATAMLLARAGLDVVLLDRASFPRPKPCGDCLSIGATDLLRRLRLLDAVATLPSSRLNGWRIFAPGGGSFGATFAPRGTAHGGAIAVERRLLDAVILDAAIDAGVTFVPDARVDDLTHSDGRVTGVRTGDRTFAARLTIGADGLRSVVATRLNAVRRPPRLRKVSQTLHIDCDAAVNGFGEMHVGDGLCVGLAPVTRDRRRCNLTVVADADRFGRDIAYDNVRFIEEVIGRMPGLHGRLDNVEIDGNSILASGPFDRPVRTVAFDGATLVGDAAGYYDPFTGQGVHQALATAELLAPIAAAALRAGPVTAASLRPYARAHARLVRGPHSVQRGVEMVLSRPRLADRAIGRIDRAEAFGRALLDVTGDAAPISRLVHPRVLYSLVSLRER